MKKNFFYNIKFFTTIFSDIKNFFYVYGEKIFILNF